MSSTRSRVHRCDTCHVASEMVVAAAAVVVLTLLPGTTPLGLDHCLALPIVDGQRGGGDYRNFELSSGSNASECRAACCAHQACAFWGLDVKLPPPSRWNCTQGKACCWLKTAKASRVNPPCPWGCYTGKQHGSFVYKSLFYIALS